MQSLPTIAETKEYKRPSEVAAFRRKAFWTVETRAERAKCDFQQQSSKIDFKVLRYADPKRPEDDLRLELLQIETRKDIQDYIKEAVATLQPPMPQGASEDAKTNSQADIDVFFEMSIKAGGPQQPGQPPKAPSVQLYQLISFTVFSVLVRPIRSQQAIEMQWETLLGEAQDFSVLIEAK